MLDQRQRMETLSVIHGSWSELSKSHQPSTNRIMQTSTHYSSARHSGFLGIRSQLHSRRVGHAVGRGLAVQVRDDSVLIVNTKVGARLVELGSQHMQEKLIATTTSSLRPALFVPEWQLALLACQAGTVVSPHARTALSWLHYPKSCASGCYVASTAT